jgi:NADH-quinone oxidoreductase subunit J
MTGQEGTFVGLGAIATIAAALVVTTRNVVHGALYLVAVLGSIGAVFILLGAEFIGWVQVLIYVGAIVVLVLFAIMLTRAPVGRQAMDNQQRLVALVVAGGVFAVMTWLVWHTFGDEKIPLRRASRIRDVGSSLFTGFVLPFEAVSVLLLAALVGAIVLARRD